MAVQHAPSVVRIRTHSTHIHLAFIDGWAHNPPTRIKGDPSLSDLTRSLAEDGQVAPIAVVRHGTRYLLADGHRRVQAAGLLGWTDIWAIVYEDYTPATLPKLAALLNLQRLHYGLREFLEGVRQGEVDLAGVLAQLPPRYHKIIQRWIEEVPAAEVPALLTTLQTPYAMNQAGAVLRHLKWPSARRLEVLRWMAGQGSGASAKVRHLLRAGVPARTLAAAIEQGRALW